jgi:ribonucleoside-triphosphate reductase
MERTECQTYSRVVGYMRPTTNWNLGKQEEFKDRTMFKIEDVKK